LVMRFNGEPAASLISQKVGEQDIVQIAEMVRAYVRARNGVPFEPTPLERLDIYTSHRERAYTLGLNSAVPLPPGAQISFDFDYARFVEGRLDLMTRNALQGAVLVFLTLLLFLNWRAAVWVGTGLIIALCGTFALMYWFDITLNFLTMFGIIVVLSWGYTQVFSGRAALLHLGALTATIMTANVAMIIIPNQKIVVADLKAGRKPDPKYGKIAKLRSTHNNYLTLPVIFLMLSNHYPLAFASAYNWLIAALVFLMGVTIRHFFNTMHARGGYLWWTWGATVAIFMAIVALSMLPLHGNDRAEDTASLTPLQQDFTLHEAFPDVTGIVHANCAMCHAQDVSWPGLAAAPGGVMIDTDARIAQQAQAIYINAGVSHAMPPGNYSFITEDDRDLIRVWYRDVMAGAS